MKDIGLNINEIRNLNKIKVYPVKNGGVFDTKPLFEAYLTSPLGNFDATVEASSLTQEIGEAIGGLGIVGKLGLNKLGNWIAKSLKSGTTMGNLLGTGFDMANQINYNFNYRFNNVSSFEHTFNCELVVKDDYIEDLMKPLWNIIEYVMPGESPMASETDLYKEISRYFNEGGAAIRKGVDAANAQNPFIEPDVLKKFWDYVKDVAGEVGDMAGGLSILSKPKQLGTGMSHTRIMIGDYIEIDNVIITSIGFNVPYLLYEGGMFDKVDITLKVKGNRKMTVKTYDWIRRLARVGTNELSGMDSLTSAPTQTLNSMFASKPPMPIQQPSYARVQGIDTIENNTGNLG